MTSVCYETLCKNWSELFRIESKKPVFSLVVQNTMTAKAIFVALLVLLLF